MGWWRTVNGAVIGDPAADYVETLALHGRHWIEPDRLPTEVREQIDALYVEGIGRTPTDEEVRTLLVFCA